MNKHTLIVAMLAAFVVPPVASAQTGTDMVEVEPITCWWRTSTSAIRTGEPFGLRLTCAVLETEATRIVPDFSKLEANVVQLPPFEVLGGTHPGDLVTIGKRFFQYDYQLRLLAEDAFGADVAVPPLEISYRVESKVSGGESVQGRDQSYALPRASIRLISLVPDDTTDIRESPASAFAAIESRVSRANLFQTIAGVLFALAGLLVLLMLFGMLRRKAPMSEAARARVGPRTVLGAVAGELADVQRASRGGWTSELSGRALSALRIAGSYATGRAIGQRPVKEGDTAVDGQLLVSRGFGRSKALVSGSVTPESAPDGTAPGLADALRALTIARYGRREEVFSAADDALDTAIRITRQQQSAHSRIREWRNSFLRSLVDLRKKAWS
jgi:hypothetical protein